MRHLFRLGLCLAFLLTGPVLAAETNLLEFRTHEVAAERDAPQVCLTFSDKLDRNITYDRFVRVEPAIKAAFQVRENTLCVDGFQHGQRYTLTLRKGFPAVEGKTLEAQRQIRVNVRDRAPQVSFRSSGYILPHVEDEGLQVRTLNVARVRMQVLRIKDQGVLEQMHMGLSSKALTDADVEDMIGRTGERLWQGDMAVDGAPNKPVTTAFPLKAALGDLAPGAYVAVAESGDGKDTGRVRRAVQWFLISDLGLTAFTHEDGVLVYVRSLKTAQPRAGIELKLVGGNNEELGRVTTGADGMARFSVSKDKAPKALFARSEAGDFSFMEVGANAADAAHQGDGRAFLYTGAGIYKPGGTVHLTALLRTPDGEARTGVPLRLSIKRPDGVEVERRTLNQELAGGYSTQIELSPTAHAGTWTIVAYAENSDKPSGKAAFVVEDFAPARLDFSVAADRATIGDDGRLRLNISAYLQNGVPAGNVSGEVRATLRPTQQAAYPGFESYRFGLAQETSAFEQAETKRFTTYASGKGRVELTLDRSGDTTRPLEAVLQTTLFDVDGRAVSHEVVVPLQPAPFAIGMRPLFGGGALPENATAAFDIVAIGSDGRAIDRPNLSYELYEEKSEYLWFETEGRWDYRTIIKDRRVTGGMLNVSAANPVRIEEQVASGRFRLEVFDPETGVASSVRFSAGWWLANAPGDQPGKVEVTLMQPSYAPGQVAWVFIRPPYPAQVLLTVAGRTVYSAMTRPIGEEGAFLEIPVQDWMPGAYMLATAYAASNAESGMAPRRAAGSTWLGVDASTRKLNVSIKAPETIQPHQIVSVPVKVEGISEGKPAYVTLAAVDEASLQTVGSAPADPIRFFLQRPLLGVNVRDAQGTLMQPDNLLDPVVAEDAGKTGKEVHTGNGVSLFSGIQAVGADGTVTIPLELPKGNGRVRLAATAWSADKVGYTESNVEVREPVSISMDLPASMKLGDELGIDYAMHNATGPAGTYRLKVSASGALAADEASREIENFQTGQNRRSMLKLSAIATGMGEVQLDVVGPDNVALTRTWRLNVEYAQPRTVQTVSADIKPGATQTFAVAELAADLKGAKAFYTVSTLPGLNVPLLLSDVLGASVQNVETAASRGLSLLNARDVARALRLIETDDAYGAAIADAVMRVADFQKADGSFSTWSSLGGTNYWQSVYAMDFLTRARKAGYAVPELPYGRGVEFLKRTMGGDWTEDKELALRSYTLNVLARSGAVDAGAVAYFQDNHWNRLPTRLSRAHIANALAVAGDVARAGDAFAKLGNAQETSVQDDAEILTMMAESGAVGEDELRNALRGMRNRLKDGIDHLHIQTRTWLLVAANALRPLQGEVHAKLNGVSVTESGSLTRVADMNAAEIQLENTGDRTLYVTLTVVGESKELLPAEQNGLSVKRSVFDTKGRPANLGKLRQNQVLVVVLEGQIGPETNRVLLTDEVPTGFEIETLQSGRSADAWDMPWLGELSSPVYAADQGGRFVAALDVGNAEKRDVRVAYLVRATIPGRLQAPGTYMEGMNRSDLFAYGPAGQVTVERRRAAN